jgi:hypothetical protein
MKHIYQNTKFATVVNYCRICMVGFLLTMSFFSFLSCLRETNDNSVSRVIFSHSIKNSSDSIVLSSIKNQGDSTIMIPETEFFEFLNNIDFHDAIIIDSLPDTIKNNITSDIQFVIFITKDTSARQDYPVLYYFKRTDTLNLLLFSKNEFVQILKYEYPFYFTDELFHFVSYEPKIIQLHVKAREYKENMDLPTAIDNYHEIVSLLKDFKNDRNRDSNDERNVDSLLLNNYFHLGELFFLRIRNEVNSDNKKMFADSCKFFLNEAYAIDSTDLQTNAYLTRLYVESIPWNDLSKIHRKRSSDGLNNHEQNTLQKIIAQLFSLKTHYDLYLYKNEVLMGSKTLRPEEKVLRERIEEIVKFEVNRIVDEHKEILNHYKVNF